MRFHSLKNAAEAGYISHADVRVVYRGFMICSVRSGRRFALCCIPRTCHLNGPNLGAILKRRFAYTVSVYLTDEFNSSGGIGAIEQMYCPGLVYKAISEAKVLIDLLPEYKCSSAYNLPAHDYVPVSMA